MDRRIILCAFMAFLAVKAAPTSEEKKTIAGISLGPHILNDKDREALAAVFKIPHDEISNGLHILNDDDRAALAPKEEISNGLHILNDDDRAALAPKEEISNGLHILDDDDRAALAPKEEISNGLHILNDDDRAALAPKEEISNGLHILNDDDRAALAPKEEISNGLHILNDDDRAALAPKEEISNGLHILDDDDRAALAPYEQVSNGLHILNDDDREALLKTTNQKKSYVGISSGPLILNDEDREALAAAFNKPAKTSQEKKSFKGISSGPLILNDEDREALAAAFNVPAKTSQEKKSFKGISSGPLILNDEDREALLAATQQKTTDHEDIDRTNPGQKSHGILEGLVKAAETATGVLKRVVRNVQNHEEESHNAIDEIRSNAPETADDCVRDVFGTSNRFNPIYCGVKFFSQVAIGLYDMSQTVVPLKKNLQKLSADLAECKKSDGMTTKFICRAQAYRDGWQTSENIRSRLGQHLTVIRYLAMAINSCTKDNKGVQAHLVNQVAECAKSRAA